jgi:outer membrane receptor protein involved in Fe transport
MDRLRPVGLYNTNQRNTWNTVREDNVTQRSLALWAQNELRWTSWLRSITGLRGDAYDFAVDSNLSTNSGKASDQMVTPKFSLVFGPWQKTELYLNYGHGFHSNDARGTTITQEPGSGNPVGRVKPLVRTKGSEIGLRTKIVQGWQSTVALWQLESASELLFVGDAGTTEASRPSRRYGVEWTNLYVPTDWLAIDADLAVSHARFRDSDVAGNYIPGAVSSTANLGLTVAELGPWFGALRFRYFGPRPLIEDNSVRSSGSALTNLRLGYKFDKRTQVALDIYNLFDRKANDIEYWYESQLSNETAAQGDRHIHPSEPRTLRLTITHRF